MQGGRRNIRPDIVLLVNGIPHAIIECKSPSPTLGEGWKAEEADQFRRYQELETRCRELGAPKLFELVQLLVATCGHAACYGAGSRYGALSPGRARDGSAHEAVASCISRTLS